MESYSKKIHFPQSLLTKLFSTSKHHNLLPQIYQQHQLASQPQLKNHPNKYTEIHQIMESTNTSFNSKNYISNKSKYKPYQYSTTMTQVKCQHQPQSPIPKIQNNKKYRSQELIKSKSKHQQSIPGLQQPQILQNYKIITHIGKGSFSIVSSALNKSTNTPCAIKTYTKINQIDPNLLKNIQNQINILSTLKHQNIIQLYHAVKNKNNILLIMENGGKLSLSRLLRKYDKFDQINAKKYFLQIANALAYCHQSNICHRDLKLQNILINQSGNVKLIDFGFSIKCPTKTRLTIPCGTPPYMSPQLATRSNYNGYKSDIWALGVILYLMLHGKYPFQSNNEKQLYRLIQQGKYKYNDNLSLQVKNLISSMLKLDQNTRITAEDIIHCNWLQIDK